MHTVPNIVHFIYPCEGTRPLSYLNYMAVKLAKEIQKPDSIFFWIDGEPTSSPWWYAIQPLVEIKTYQPVKEYGGTPIQWPQYASDVFRLQLLRDHGGIYMDTDMLLLHPLTAFTGDTLNGLVMCYEPTQKNEPESICNAMIIAEPENDFIIEWLERMPNALQNKVWAHGGVQIPYLLHKEKPDLGNHKIKPSSYFCPLDLSKNWLFSSDLDIISEAEKIVSGSYAIHGFETFWRNIVKDVTPNWCYQNDSLFTRLFNRS